MSRHRLGVLATALCALVPVPAAARVISYAPISAANATPGVQPRAGRHVLLSEDVGTSPCSGCGSASRLVLYDATGVEPPRAVLSPAGGAAITVFAMSEGSSGQACLFAGTDANLAGENPQRYYRYLLSTDAGSSWRSVDLGPVQVAGTSSDALEFRDRGGPVSGGRGAAVFPGNADTPFLVVGTPFWPMSGSTLFAVDRNAQARPLFLGAPMSPVRLLGADAGATRFLVQGTPLDGGTALTWGVWQVDLAGTRKLLIDTSGNVADQPDYGWVRRDGRAYVALRGYPSTRRLVLTSDAGPVEILSASPAVQSSPPEYVPHPAFFAVPTADFTGAWIVRRDDRTRVLSHHGQGAPVEALALPLEPAVEGLFEGASGARLLLQSERRRAPRDGGDTGFDPLLAVWQPGQPAPADWAEMLLFTGGARRFVHLDVDALVNGDPFVFDAAYAAPTSSGGPSGGPSGGGDLLQEWGVVRSGLKQRLLVPAVARATGALGALWRTDLVLRNPDAAPVQVSARLMGTAPGSATFSLAGNEIRFIPDVLAALGMISGSGTLVLEAEPFRSVEATSRTWTTAAGGGTFGMGVPAVDAYAAATPGFPVYFAAGLGGSGYRTNAVFADALGSGATATLASSTEAGAPQSREVSIAAGDRLQVNDVAAYLGVPAADAGALRLLPSSGALVSGAIVLDQKTDDPSWLAPDIPTTTERTIPAIVHAVGVGETQWRSDLYLFNPSTVRQTVFLAAKSWDQPETDQTIAYSLAPGESRVEPDILWNVFRRWGVARLQVRSTGGPLGSDSVRAMARVYALSPDGGTRGFALPPLNGFQTGRDGETLTILGAVGGAGFRTNLALVELSDGSAVPQASTIAVGIEILDEHGATIDAFAQNVPVAGGVQVGDLFRTRGLGDGPGAALLRITMPRSTSYYGSVNVAAYATLVDNGSGDATYLPAQLETP